MLDVDGGSLLFISSMRLLRLLLLLFASVCISQQCVQTFTSRQQRSGTFASPNFPKNYPPNVDCSYHFRGAVGEVVAINWTNFELEEPFERTNQCLRDYIEVIITDIQGEQHISGRYCGSHLPAPIQTMQTQVTVEFRSSHTGQFTGFAGTYAFVDEKQVLEPKGYYYDTDLSMKSQCGGHSNDGEHDGEIVNPGYPTTFPANVTCNWLIRVDRGKKIYIRLLELELAPTMAECDRAALYIIDGYKHEVLSLRKLPPSSKRLDSVDDPSQVRFCGVQLYYKEEGMKSYMSTQNRIIVRFITTQRPTQSQIDSHDADGGKPIGFRLIWTEVDTVIDEMVVVGGAKKVIQQQSTLSKDTDLTHCAQFACRGGDYCLDDGRNICATRRQLCIDKSLLCNGRPNCAENDESDEENCYSLQIIIAGSSLIALLVFVILCAIVYQHRHNRRHVRRMRKQQRDNLNNTMSSSITQTSSLAATTTSDNLSPMAPAPLNYSTGTFRRDDDDSIITSDIWQYIPRRNQQPPPLPPAVRLHHIDHDRRSAPSLVANHHNYDFRPKHVEFVVDDPTIVRSSNHSPQPPSSTTLWRTIRPALV